MNQIDLFKTIIIPILKGLLSLWKIWLLLGAIALAKFAFQIWEMKKLAKSGINQIDKMDGRTFEKYLEALFNKLGYRVERTQYVGDYGADLITQKDGVRTVIQAKRYKQKVGIKSVQEAVAAKGKYNCTNAMVVTNSFFTKAAIELAEANKVELWNRDRLVKALLSIKQDRESIPNHASPGSGVAEVNTVSELTAEISPSNIEKPMAVPDRDVCHTCGKTVTEKVKMFCLAHPNRFGGKIFCYDHQRNQ